MRVNLLVVTLIMILLLPTVFAEENQQVLINSRDWQDVYAGALYANRLDLPVHYVLEEGHALELAKSIISREKKKILLIESETTPYITGYESTLKQEGFEIERLVSSDGNELTLQLAERALKDGAVQKYIVVDTALGYNAISVTPYAMLSNAFVIFADKTNAEEVYNFIQQNMRPVLLYGYLDREVKSRLNEFSPVVINNGDRYLDNLDIVDMFLKESNSNQVVLTHGEVLEPGIFTAEFPILFIGLSTVPQQIIDYIDQSDITTGVVIGYELYDNAKLIREQTGIRIFLKYGQGRNSQMYALDVLELPKYDPKLNIKAVRYNTITKQLEVIYENTGDVFMYLQSLSHVVKVGDDTVATLGDPETVFLGREDVLAVTYDVDLIEFTSDKIRVETKVAFGESPKSLTKILSKTSEVEIVSVDDKSRVEVGNLVYDPRKQVFELSISNTETENAVYADPEMVDIVIAGDKFMYSGQQQRIAPLDTRKFQISAPMLEEDFKDNQDVKLRVRYGERADGLIKSVLREYELVIKPDYLLIGGVAAGVLVLILLIILLRRKGGKNKRGHHPGQHHYGHYPGYYGGHSGQPHQHHRR